MDLAVVALTFGAIFVVELPDKTFIATLVLATKFRPLLVWIGVGLAAIGASLIGRDVWAWGNVAILAGVVFVAVGAFRNRTYLRELLMFRGAARRGRGSDRPLEPPVG